MTALILLSEWNASQIEFWKPVEGFTGYDVSNLGRVRSYRGYKHLGGKEGSRRMLLDTPMILKPTKNRGNKSDPDNGYAMAVLVPFGEGKPKRVFVHRLVAQSFIPNPNNLPQVNHKNFVKRDPRIDNLEWITSRGNREHAIQYGSGRGRGENHPKALVTESDVKEIRTRVANGEKYNPLAAEFGICREAIHRIVKRLSWREVE